MAEKAAASTALAETAAAAEAARSEAAAAATAAKATEAELRTTLEKERTRAATGEHRRVARKGGGTNALYLNALGSPVLLSLFFIHRRSPPCTLFTLSYPCLSILHPFAAAAEAEAQLKEAASVREALEIHQGSLLSELSKESAAAKANAKRAHDLQAEAAVREPRLEAAEKRVGLLEAEIVAEKAARASSDAAKDAEVRCLRAAPSPVLLPAHSAVCCPSWQPAELSTWVSSIFSPL